MTTLDTCTKRKHSDVSECSVTKTSREPENDVSNDEKRSASFFEDMVVSFWSNDLTEEELRRFSNLIRSWLPGIPPDTDDVTVVANLKLNLVTGESLDDIIHPRALEMLYTGELDKHPFGHKLPELYSGQVLFGGIAPPDHPHPYLFANDKLHVALPRQSSDYTFRLSMTAEDLDGEFGKDHFKAIKAFFLFRKAMEDDVILFKDGRELKPPEESVKQAKEIFAERISDSER